MKTKTTIIIVDDHMLFSQSLEFLVNSFKGFHVVANYPNGKAFLNGYEKGDQQADIVLLDVNMPIMDGLETMKNIKEKYPTQKVLSLSVNNDEETVMAMIANGGRGYLLKDTTPINFQQALEEVRDKGYYYSEMVTSYLVNKIGNKEQMVFKNREIEFINLACTEKTYKEIADILFVSPKTVDGYREHLFRKVGVKTRVGLVLYAIKNRIISI